MLMRTLSMVTGRKSWRVEEPVVTDMRRTEGVDSTTTNGCRRRR